MEYHEITLRVPVQNGEEPPAEWDWRALLDTADPVYVVEGDRYSNEDLAERLLNNVGQEVEIVTYSQPGGEILNIALENIETSTVILDFDL